jgi:transposase-like protein
MTSDPDLSAHWCWNTECSDYGKKDHGNIVLKDRKGKNKFAILRCKTCNKCFSESRGTMFFGLTTPPDKILRALALLPEKGGIRGVARVTGHGRNNITRWIKRAAAQAKLVNQYFLQDLQLTQVQVDEIWAYIKKTTKYHPE